MSTHETQPRSAAADEASVLTARSRVLAFLLTPPELQRGTGGKLLGDAGEVTFLGEIRGFAGIQVKCVGQREGVRDCRAYSGR